MNLSATAITPEISLREAGPIWLESRRPFLSGHAFTRYAFYLRPLKAFFSNIRLGDITPDQIRAYQRTRSMLAISGNKPATAGTINHECSCLQQMLKRVGHWQDIAHDYQPLPLPKTECGRALTDQEYKRLLRMAASNKNWLATFCFVVISLNTTFGPGEVMALRLADVDLRERTISVPAEGAKNPERQRTNPLNDYALAAVEAALERAHKLGSHLPEHYLFPYGAKGRIDVTKHQTTLKRAWKELCVAADVRGFRLYDCRHHAITALLENPKISDQTAEALAGHISVRMKRRYSHIRMEAKRAALNALAQSWECRADKQK